MLFPDKSGTHIQLFLLPLLLDLEEVGTFSWSGAILACLYRSYAEQHGLTFSDFRVSYPSADLVVGADKRGPTRDIAAMVWSGHCRTRIIPQSSGMPMEITSFACREPLTRSNFLKR